jgi:hypothetical protein
MKAIYTFAITVLLVATWGCEEDNAKGEYEYAFVKEYRAWVTVGGVVGVEEKYFKAGDVFVGHKKHQRVVTIRIAEHTSRNEGPPTSASYQEFLDVPIDYLVRKEFFLR